MGHALARNHEAHEPVAPHLVPLDQPAEEEQKPERVDDSTSDASEGALTDLEHRVLRLEAQFPRHSARKNERIRRDLGISTTRYYQILGTLIEKPEALASEPTLVARLRRLQHTRASERLARRELRQSLSRATQEKIR